MGRKLKKRLLIAGSVVVILLVVVLVAWRIIGGVLEKNHITYKHLSFQFPAEITLQGIRAEPGDGLRIQLEELKLGWSWGSLFRARPLVHHLYAHSGHIRMNTDPHSTSGAKGKVPRFMLRQVRLQDILLDLHSETDSLRIQLTELFLNAAVVGERIEVDTLRVQQAFLQYGSWQQETGQQAEIQPGGETFTTLDAIPGFEINFLDLSQCGFELRQQDQRQRVDRLELALTGWKSSELFHVGIQHLRFVYQDTLDVDLILEDGNINREFQVELGDLALEIPGISLRIARVQADLQEGIRGNLTLAPSNLNLGRIRQVYSGIDSILHPALPDTTKIHLEGGLELDGNKLSLHSLGVRTLDSTSMQLNGIANLHPDPSMELAFHAFKSTRSDLIRLMAPQNYHRFYLWPHDMEGTLAVDGTLNDLVISGNIDSKEGVLMAESHVKSDSLGGLYFSLLIQSDSVYVNGITDLLPVSVPHGQLRFYLELRDTGQEEIAPLRIDITSEHLYAFERYIQDIRFAYDGDAKRDSMFVSLADTAVALEIALVTPQDGDGTTYVEGSVDQVFPAAFFSSWPEGALSTRLDGAFRFVEEESRAELVLTKPKLSGVEQHIALPDSRIKLSGRGERITLIAESEGDPFLTALTGTRFPEFSLPLPEWLARWPETEVQLRGDLEEGLLELLTGTPGQLNLDTFILLKDSLQWKLYAEVPQLTFGAHRLEGLSLEMSSHSGELSGKIAADQLLSESLQAGGVSLSMGYGNQQYRVSLENRDSDLLGSNRISVVAEKRNQGYNIRFNDGIPLLINQEAWEIYNNQGVTLNSDFRLLEGDLGILQGSSKVEAVTDGQQVRLHIDSLELKSLLAYVTDGEWIRGQLNGEVVWDAPQMDLAWEGSMVASNEQVPDQAHVHFKGSKGKEKLETELEFSHKDASASGTIRKIQGPLEYHVLLDRFSLEALRYVPGLPPDLEVTGLVSGMAFGRLAGGITAEGFLVVDSLYVVPPLTGSPLRVDHDTLFLLDSDLILRNFMVRDARDDSLSLSGKVQFHPELEGKVQLRSDQFALLRNQEAGSRLQGNLATQADLEIEGGSSGLRISGTLQTLPGANVTYVSEKSFHMVDASQIVTFMDLETEQARTSLPARESRLDMEWDLDLKVNQTSVEVLLDEISQEYIRINSQGSIQMKSGVNSYPMVYGSITSSEGRAFINPPAIPDLNLVIDDARIQWKGLLDEPVISFRGYKYVKGVTSGLSQTLEGDGQLVDYKVYVILDEVTLSEFDLQFDLEVEDSEAEILLASLPQDTRQNYAVNLLVFGRIGTEKIKGNALLANQVTRKLNELSRRNLKNTGLSFSSANYTDRSDGLNERERTDLSYSLSRGFLNNRLKVAVGGSVGFYMDDLTMLPPSNLVGDLELSYRLSDKPTLILKGTRKNVYEGIIDGMVTEESLGLLYQKSFKQFPLLPGKMQKEEGDTP